MISALKITAARMADVGECNCMKSMDFNQGRVPAKRAGTMAKYFATSLAMEKVVKAPRVMRSCLPTSTTSINFVGSLSRSTMFPASLAAWVPLFMATPTSAWARAARRWCHPPSSPPVSLPLLLADVRQFRFRGGLGNKIVHARLLAMLLAVSGLSPVTITVRSPIRRSRSKRSLIPGLRMSSRTTMPAIRAFSLTNKGVCPCWQSNRFDLGFPWERFLPER